MIRVLMKEFREHRSLLVWLILGSAGLLPLLERLEIVRDPEETAFVIRFVIMMIAACLGASLVGPEAASGTLEILWTRPLARWRVWAGKALFGLGAAAILGSCLAFALAPDVALRKAQDHEWLFAWLMLSMAGCAAGFAFSGAFSRPLAAGLAGFGLTAAAHGAIFTARLRPGIFWPSVIAGCLLASWFTYRTATGSARRRHGALALGLLAGTLLYCGIGGTMKLAALAVGAPRVQALDSPAELAGRRLVNVYATTFPSRLEPFLSAGGTEWKDGAESRTALIDPETGKVSWTEGSERNHFRVSIDKRWLLALFYPRDDPGRLELRLSAAGNEAASERIGLSRYPSDWIWNIQLLGVRADGTLLVTGLDRDGVRALTPTAPGGYLDSRHVPYARARLLGADGDRPADLADAGGTVELRARVEDARFIEAENAFLVTFGWSDRASGNPGLRGRWLFRLEEKTLEPARVREDSNKPIAGAEFLNEHPRAGGARELFHTDTGHLGLCGPDGSGATLLRSPENEAVLDEGTRSTWWSEDAKFATIAVAGSSDDANQLLFLDAAAGLVSPLPTLSGGIAACTPMEEGAYALTRKEREPDRLWWLAPGAKTPVLARQAPHGRIAARCSHDPNHPFALEWTASAPRGSSSLNYRPSSLASGGCFWIDGSDAPVGADFSLLVFRPPSRGGLAALKIGRNVAQYGVSAAVRGDRVLVRGPGEHLSLVARDEATVIPMPVPTLAPDEPSETGTEIVWVDDRHAVVRTRDSLSAIDVVTRSGRPLIRISP